MDVVIPGTHGLPCELVYDAPVRLQRKFLHNDKIWFQECDLNIQKIIALAFAAQLNSWIRILHQKKITEATKLRENVQPRKLTTPTVALSHGLMTEALDFYLFKTGCHGSPTLNYGMEDYIAIRHNSMKNDQKWHLKYRKRAPKERKICSSIFTKRYDFNIHNWLHQFLWNTTSHPYERFHSFLGKWESTLRKNSNF